MIDSTVNGNSKRATNGLVHPEQFANSIGATLKDYAQGGARVSKILSPPRAVCGIYLTRPVKSFAQ